MTIQRIPPDLADRIRVVLVGPSKMRVVVECAICDDVCVWMKSREVWVCENCEVSTSTAELAGLFQDCVDALGGQDVVPKPRPPERPRRERLGEKWRKILLEEIQQRLQKAGSSD